MSYSEVYLLQTNQIIVRDLNKNQPNSEVIYYNDPFIVRERLKNFHEDPNSVTVEHKSAPVKRFIQHILDKDGHIIAKEISIAAADEISEVLFKTLDALEKARDLYRQSYTHKVFQFTRANDELQRTYKKMNDLLVGTFWERLVTGIKLIFNKHEYQRSR